MTDPFRDKRFVVTGGASGIGFATAAGLIARGAQVEIWDVDAAALADAAEKLRATPVCIDICDATALDHAFGRAAAERIDGVVHCAAILRTGMFEGMPSHEHLAIVTVNLGGTALLAYTALPYLRKSRGSLILLGSVSAFIASPEFATYAASKAGIYSLAQTLQIEVSGSGVHIGIANPLFVNSPMLTERVRSTGSFRAKSPFLRVYTPEQVAQSILRGIERREFMIWTGARPRLIYAISRYGAWFAQRLVRRTWAD
jgi:NAD(P)-dependent dehydrogenase (short-subunit alcohol dehydrogenase family)